MIRIYYKYKNYYNVNTMIQIITHTYIVLFTQMFLTRIHALCLYININIGTSFIFNLKRVVQLKTRVFFIFKFC